MSMALSDKKSESNISFNSNNIDYSKQPTIILHILVNDIIKDYSFTLHIQSPFTCSLDVYLFL